jgi:hypothetical protein
VQVGLVVNGKGCTVDGDETIFDFTLPDGEFAGQSVV